MTERSRGGQAVRVTVEPGPEQFALSISVGQEMTPGAEYTFEFAMLDEDGEPVTVTQTAR